MKTVFEIDKIFILLLARIMNPAHLVDVHFFFYLAVNKLTTDKMQTFFI